MSCHRNESVDTDHYRVSIENGERIVEIRVRPNSLLARLETQQMEWRRFRNAMQPIQLMDYSEAM